MSTPTATGPNFPEIEAILEHIDAHPQEWYQGTYGTQTACGTAFCVAGHAVIRAGWTTEPGHHYRGQLHFIDPAGEAAQLTEVHNAAMEALSLSGFQADVLFAGSNTRGELTELVEQLKVDPTTSDPAALARITDFDDYDNYDDSDDGE